MDKKIILESIDFWQKIDNKLDFKNYISYSSKKDIYSKFIREFPELKKENIDIIINYIKRYNGTIEIIKIFEEYLNKENLYKLLDCLNIHKEHILRVLDINNTFESKKRLYLGLIWFGLGFYISYFINKILGYEERLEYFSLQKVSNNKYIIFLTTSFIFYDGIFDDKLIELEAKKICIDYTKYFLEYLINNSLKQITSKNLLDKYLFEKEINLDNLKEESKVVIKKSNRILDVLLEETIQQKNLKKLECIYELFCAEIITSKIQHNHTEIDEKKILECTIYKSSMSIIAIMQCIISDQNIKNDEKLNKKIYMYAFLTQLLDDFNDIKIDKEEKNLTIFSYCDTNSKNENNINKLFNYIYYLKYQYEKEYQDKDLIDINYYFNLLIFNYSLSKYENKLYISKLSDYILFNRDDINYLRKEKNKFVNKYNIKKELSYLI